MPARHFIIGTAGHIDHGKSTLVHTLTGTNPDRLPEEKERGVTIELGFAHLSLPVPNKTTETFEIGLVDVPGHADFVNNMVSGVGAIDLALFVVAADDSWMPQSEEHLQILSYLGIRKFIVVLTKADLCEDLDFVTEMMADDLQGTILEGAPIVPVSAPTGLGIDRLRENIAHRLQEIDLPRDFGKARLAVDRTFSPKGVGTVVTGTLTSGSVRPGDRFTAFPTGLTTSVRAIQSHSSVLDEAFPGMRTALNLPDLPLAQKGKKGVSRGHLLVAGTSDLSADASLELDVVMTRSSRPIPGQRGTLRPIKSNHRVYVHHGSGRSPARVLFPEETLLQPGDTSLAQLRFEEPIYAMAGERFVIRELSGEATLAGATVLDPHPTRRQFRSQERQSFLKKRAAAPENLATLLTTRIERDRFVPLSHLSRGLPFSTAEIKTALKKLTKSHTIAQLQDGKFLLWNSLWKDLTKLASKVVKSYHQTHPDLSGMPTEALKKELLPVQGIPGFYDALLQWMSENRFRVAENLITHEDHSLELPDHLKAPAAEILDILDAAGLNPPLPTALQSTSNHEAAYRFLSRTRQILPLDPKVTLSQKSYQEAVSKTQAHIKQHGPTTASELRQALDTSRKILMPLLERLDREKVTLRDGDYRTLA